MNFKHETVISNQDIGFNLLSSEDKYSIVPKHWHYTLEIIYIITANLEINIRGIDYILSE